MLYYNIGTTNGQSGSPVYLMRDGMYYLIGVHCGYDEYEDSNVAVGLNNKLVNWIHSTIPKEKITIK